MSGVTRQDGQAHLTDFDAGFFSGKASDSGKVLGSICCIPGVSFALVLRGVLDAHLLCLYNNHNKMGSGACSLWGSRLALIKTQ